MLRPAEVNFPAQASGAINTRLHSPGFIATLRQLAANAHGSIGNVAAGYASIFLHCAQILRRAALFNEVVRYERAVNRQIGKQSGLLPEL